MPVATEQRGIAGVLGQMCGVALAPVKFPSAPLVIASLHRIQFLNLRPRHIRALRTLRAYYTVSVDGQLVWTSEVIAENDSNPSWEYPKTPLQFPVYPSSKLTLAAWRDGHVRGRVNLGQYEAPLLSLLNVPKVLFHLSSEDSPDSEVRVNMFVNPASDPVMCGLEYAEDRIAEVEYANESMSALNAAMIGMNALHTLVHNVSSIHPMAKVGCIFLSSASRSLAMYTDIDEDIQSLVEAMKDTLNDAKQCRNPWATDRSERCLFDVIRLITEGAALIDEWNHTHVLARHRRASDLNERIAECTEQLYKIKARFPLELLLVIRDDVCVIKNAVAEVLVRLDGLAIKHEMRSGDAAMPPDIFGLRPMTPDSDG